MRWHSFLLRTPSAVVKGVGGKKECLADGQVVQKG
jgi:hypothetical protein